MKYLKELKKIFSKKVNWIYFFSISFILFWVFRILPHIELLWGFWNTEGISLERFFEVFWEKTISIMWLSTFWNNFTAFTLPIMISLNIILFKELYQKQKLILKSKGFFGSIVGMFFGFFGVGCAACSGLLLAPLISFLGLSWLFELLPYGGEELGYVGLVMILVSNIYLLKKLTDKQVCKK